MVAISALLFVAQSSAAGPLDAAGLAGLLAADGAGAVVALADGETVPAGERAKALKAGNVRSAPGVKGAAPAVAYSDHLPFSAMSALARFRPGAGARPANPAPFPKEAVVAGTVTLKSAAGSGFRVTSLSDAKWSQPLLISPAFTEAGIGGLLLAADVQKLPELEFLRAVAKAVGGRFRQTTKGFVVEPNGTELRSRALRNVEIVRASATIPSRAQADGGGEGRRERGRRGEGDGATTLDGVSARLDFARDAISLVAPEAMEAFLDGRAPGMVVSLSGATALQNDILRILAADANDPGDGARARRLAASVSPQDPGVVQVSDGFAMEARLNVLFGRTVRPQTIRAL